MSSAPGFLPEVKSSWQAQLHALNTGNAEAQKQLDNMTSKVREGKATQSQLDQARLAHLEAGQRYNSFFESGRQFIQVALDAEQRLQRTNLTLQPFESPAIALAIRAQLSFP